MSQVTYYPEVACDATPSNLHDTQIVGVADETGNKHYLRVGGNFVTSEGGKHFLPVTIVDVDYEATKALVQLPYEADSGANRLWVPFASFRQEPEPTAGDDA